MHTNYVLVVNVFKKFVFTLSYFAVLFIFSSYDFDSVLKCRRA